MDEGNTEAEVVFGFSFFIYKLKGEKHEMPLHMSTWISEIGVSNKYNLSDENLACEQICT